MNFKITSYVDAMLSAIRVRFFLLREWIWEICFFGFHYPKFLLADTFLVLSYFFKSPYRIVREWDESHHKKIGPYGELPLSAMRQLYLQLLKDKSIASMTDVGFGRGRLVLWAAMCQKWRVEAIDCVPQFVHKLTKVLSFFRVTNVHVLEAHSDSCDRFNTDLIFINPGDLSEEEGVRLTQKLQSLTQGSYVLTIGFTLPEVELSYQWEGSMMLRCPWGEEVAVLLKKIES